MAEPKMENVKPGKVVCCCNSTTGKAEAEELQIWGQPWLHIM